MYKQKLVSLLFAVTVALACNSIFSQTPPKAAPSPHDDYAEMFARTKKLDLEIGDPKRPEWAGRYTWGSIGFSGTSMYVAPGSGFVYRPYTDYVPNNIEGMYDFGEVETRDGALHLKPKRGNLKEEEYYFVTWGERRFLISRQNMTAFLNAVNAGCEAFQPKNYYFMTLRFPNHSEDLRKQFFGVPDLPAEFKKLVLDKPLSTSISAVGESKISKANPDGTPNWLRRRTQITINAGEMDGLFVGMRLFPVDYSGSGPDIFITSVSANSATAEASIVFEGSEPPQTIVHTKLTSKIYPTLFPKNALPYVCK